MNVSAPRPIRRTRMPALIIATSAALSVAIIAAAGCSSSSAPRTGSLDVTVVAPTGVTGNITVTGPAGYSKPVGATTTLTGLAPGSYTVTAAAVTSADPIVGVLETAAVSGSPVTVTSGKAAGAATVTYTPRVGSGGLWTANFGGGVITELSAAQLAAGTSSAAATAIGVGNSRPTGTAFDPNGNLWVTKFESDTILEFPAAGLGASGTPSPGVVLASGAISFPAGLAFDGNGNLWVANLADTDVVEFTASQLISSGSPAPAVVIKIPAPASGSFSGPMGIAFDAAGDMWVVQEPKLIEFTPGQLQATGTPTPAITIGDDGSNSLNSPLGMAIDAAGGIWVANGNQPPYSVVRFSPSQLTASGTPVPAVTLTTSGSSIDEPGAIAFDASGNMWLSNLAGASPIVEFAAGQLASAGSPTPTITVTSSSLSSPWGLAFNPHASGLPIKP
jgi:sugar lactone lactonase YvrE